MDSLNIFKTNCWFLTHSGIRKVCDRGGTTLDKFWMNFTMKCRTVSSFELSKVHFLNEHGFIIQNNFRVCFKVIILAKKEQKWF